MKQISILLLAVVVGSIIIIGSYNKKEVYSSSKFNLVYSQGKSKNTIVVYTPYIFSKTVDQSKFNKENRDSAQRIVNGIKLENDKISITATDMLYEKDGSLAFITFIGNGTSYNIYDINSKITLTDKDGKTIAEGVFKLPEESVGSIPAKTVMLISLYFSPQDVLIKNAELTASKTKIDNSTKFNKR